MAWVVPLPKRAARFPIVRRVAVVGLVAGKAMPRRAEFRRAPGSLVRVLGFSSSAGQGSGSGGGVTPPAVSLPAAWLAVVLPAGYICPLLAQLAMARGEAAAFDSAAGRLTIGGRVLIGTAGKVFDFATQAAADMWVTINRARVLKEVELVAGLSPAAAATFRAGRLEKMRARAVAITANAARQADEGKRAALNAEAGFYLSKWAA